MFYIVEHDMKVHQIIDTKGKANKYGTPKRLKQKKTQNIICAGTRWDLHTAAAW